MADPSSRRRFLVGALAAPAVLVGARILGAAGSAVRSVRPRARGSSTTTCALCGSIAHAMLDPSCPSAPKVV